MRDESDFRNEAIVAIIGRANVGKSTLFNKIIGKKTAIVNNTRGVTRDRNYGIADWYGKTFWTVDTGGIDFAGENDFEPLIAEQAEFAKEEADCVIFVVDCRQGMTPQDREVIETVRKTGKPLFLAVNKVDNPETESMAYEFAKIGIENMFSVSAEHGYGLMELMEGVAETIPENNPIEIDENEIRVAIVGRPNVGKSSLVNNLLDTYRCIVSNKPGTTRDAIDSPIESDGQKYVLIDTAGIRRKGKTVQTLEKFSVIMSLKALDRCHVAVLVIDGDEGITDQDASIAGYAIDKGRSCIVLVNKWDLAQKKYKNFEEFQEYVQNKLKFLDFAPLFAVSAKTGYNLPLFFPQINQVFGEYSKRLATGPLNDCLHKAVEKNPLSHFRGKFIKLFYSAQVRNCPPTIRCFVNFPQGIHFSYKRYLTNSLRKKFGFKGTPVRLVFSRKKSNN